MDTQTMNVEIGRRIAEIRKAASEKQETTAQYLNMVRSNYTKKELGQSAFSPYELAKLAEHFGVDCHYLITGVKASYYDIHEETGLSNFAIERLRRMSYASESQILKRKGFADGESKLAAVTAPDSTFNFAAIIDAFLCADKLPQLLSSIGLYMKSRNTILSEDICNEFLRPDKYSVIEGMQKSGFGILWPGTNIATRIWLEQAKGTFTEIVTDELEKARAHDGEH